MNHTVQSDIGNQGEHEFAKLCARDGLTSNQSLIDRYGWDYIIELPMLQDQEKYLDKRQSPIECSVQVKSTESGAKKASMKLSSLYRLAISHKPSFICFISFDEDGETTSVHLTHLDSNWIDKIMGKIRSLQKDDPEVNLHEKKMQVAFNQDDLVERSKGKLLEKILSYVPDGMDEYAEQKKAFLKQGGSDNQKIISVSFQGENEDEIRKDLINISLGLKSEIKVSDFDATEVRFGVSAKSDEFPDEKPESISIIPKPNSKGVITFRESPYKAPLEFIVDVYLPEQLFIKKKEHIKIRLEGDGIQFIYHHDKINFTSDFYSKLQLSTIHKISKLFVLCVSGKVKHASINVNDITLPISLSQSNFGMPEDHIEWHKKLLFVTETTIKLCNEFNIRPEETRTTGYHLIDTFDRIEGINLILENEIGIRISYKLNEEHSNNSCITQGEVTAYSRFFISIGDILLCVFFEVSGTTSPLEDNHTHSHELIVDQLIVIDRLVVTQDAIDDIDWSELIDAWRKVKSYQQDDYLLLL